MKYIAKLIQIKIKIKTFNITQTVFIEDQVEVHTFSNTFIIDKMKLGGRVPTFVT